MPLSGGISLASNLPAGSIPTLSPASTYLAQGNALLQNLVIADGLATDAATAQAYIATQIDRADRRLHARQDADRSCSRRCSPASRRWALPGPGRSPTARWSPPTRSARSTPATT